MLDHNSEVSYLCFRPDGKELAATTLKGEIYFWEVENMYCFLFLFIYHSDYFK